MKHTRMALYFKKPLLLLLVHLTLTAALPSNGTEEGWGPWSPWSMCSRTNCGLEGIQTRRRICQNLEGCDGLGLGWKACGFHPCNADAKSLSWREEQCSLQNKWPLQDKYHVWEGVEDEESPCRLDCRAVDQPGLIHNFRDQVFDGTKCSFKGHSLGLCLSGICEEIGCDLELRTGAKLDKCGVCGGDGSSCSGPQRYVWAQEDLSQCSASCGGGQKMVQYVCRDNTNNQTIVGDFCDQSLLPTDMFTTCNENPCPARWEVSEWSHCRESCNGMRTRSVDCVSDKGGNRILVSEIQCQGTRPQSEEPCTSSSCPAWYMGSWSGCSVSCGKGTQQRSVECRNVSGNPSTKCFGAKPPDIQSCHGECEASEYDRNLEHPKMGWEKLDTENISAKESEIINPNHEESEAEEKKEFATEETRTELSTNPNFIIDLWSPCSASCGEGIRFRKVECKIFLEFSKTVATLPDKECPGIKPPETQICVEQPSCGPDQILSDHVNIVSETLPSVNGPEILALTSEENKEPSYAWKIAGFTTCTASCLGGLQESIVICVETMKEKPVAPYFCDPGNRLEIEVRTCNENPCPPRWNVSDFTHCSKSCGGGTQTRTVECIQEVAHGGNNIINLAHKACPQPPPRAQQFCNVIDCPVGWKSSEWTKCSKKCGSGFKYRKVRCQQLLSLGQMIDKPESQCNEAKPHMEESCNVEQCKFTNNPKIKANTGQEYVQKDPHLKTVKIKVGGKATVFVGTTVKVRCPVKHYDKTKITWAKGNLFFHSGKKRARHSKVSVSRKGGLKIKTIGFGDGGVYTCMATKSKADLEIFVKGIEPYLTTTEVTVNKNKDMKIWLNSINNQTKVKKHGVGELDNGNSMSKFKNKFGSTYQNKMNRIDQTINSKERSNIYSYNQPDKKNSKPSTKDKWNFYREDEFLDDYRYWDSISNHKEEDRRHKKIDKEVSNIFILKSDGKQKGNKRKLKNRKKGKHGGKIAALKSKPDNPLSWKAGKWSSCSQSCGEGQQKRRIKCTMRLSERNVSQEVPNSFCKRAKLKRPPRVQICEIVGCPKWHKSPWVPCHSADCLAAETALRTRTIHCIQDQRNIVNDSQCDANLRPGDSQPCHNQECVGVWVLGEWSPCSQTCGGGERRRSVSCEWLKGGLAPTAECSHEERPSSVISCFKDACRETWPENIFFPLEEGPEPSIEVSPLRDGRETIPCQDTSKFCGLIKTYQLCSTEKFREQCCLTCKAL